MNNHPRRNQNVLSLPPLLAPSSFASLTRETACSTRGEGGKDCIEDREGCDKAELSRHRQRRKLRLSSPPPFSKRPLNFVENFLLPLHAYVRMYFFLFLFFYPGDADENRNSMVSKICLSHLASSSFNPQFVRAASTTSDRFRFHPPSRRTL